MVVWSEDRLLLACVRARYDPAFLDEARRIVGEGDVGWDPFVHHALTQGVAPLIYDSLPDDHEIVPPSVKDKLREAYYTSATRNALLYQGLEQIVYELHKANVPVILLKGAALAQRVYGNIALRPMGDIDLLVPTGMMPRIEDALAELGYLILHRADPLLRHATFTRTDRGVTLHLEVHQHIVSSPHYRAAIPEEWLWQRPIELSIGNVPGLMLSPEATTVHCCLHYLDHISIEGGLLWLWDIVEVARNLPVDWQSMADISAAFRIALPVRAILLKCRELLGLAVPEHALSTILSLQPGFAERKAYQFCLSPRRSTASKTLFDFVTTPGLLARARFLSSRLFPSREYMKTRYSIRNPRLVPLYYPRMLLEAALDGLRATRGSPRR